MAESSEQTKRITISMPLELWERLEDHCYTLALRKRERMNVSATVCSMIECVLDQTNGGPEAFRSSRLRSFT